MNKFLQQIGFFWYRTFDSNGFIFDELKSYNIWLRYLFYISLTVFITFVVLYLGSIISLNSLDISIATKMILWLTGKFILLMTVIFTMGIFSYENCYELNMHKLLIDHKLHKVYIKENKLQFWRLRNMKWFIRWPLYIGLWCFIYLIIEESLISSFLSSNSSTMNKYTYALFLEEFDLIMKQYTAGFILSIVILDYVVIRTKKAIK